MPRHIASFALRKEVTQRNGCWKYHDDVSPAENENLAATLKYLDPSGRTQKMAFVADGPELEQEPLADPESVISLIEQQGDFQGRTRLISPLAFSDFLRGLIASNKKLHEETIKKRNEDSGHIRLVYIENMPVLGVEEIVSRPMEMVFSNLKHSVAKDRKYTLNNVILSLGEQKFEFAICYSY